MTILNDSIADSGEQEQVREKNMKNQGISSDTPYQIAI